MADPCESCLRWYECNGVDRENCPLWEEVCHEAQGILLCQVSVLQV